MKNHDLYDNAYPLVAGIIDRQMYSILNKISSGDDSECLKAMAFMLGLIEENYQDFLKLVAPELGMIDFLRFYDQYSATTFMPYWCEMLEQSTYIHERCCGRCAKREMDSSDVPPDKIMEKYILAALGEHS